MKPSIVYNENASIAYNGNTYKIPQLSNFLGSFGKVFSCDTVIDAVTTFMSVSTNLCVALLQEFTVTMHNVHKYIAGFECPPYFGYSTQRNPVKHQAKWSDVCAATSEDGLHWKQIRGNYSIYEPDQSRPEQVAVAPGPADSNVELRPWGTGFLLTTRYDFPFGGHTDPPYRWRGIRGTRILSTTSSDLSTAKWILEAAWKLDMEYGEHEHLRRQIYSLTSTLYEGVHFGLFRVLEWPRGTSEGQDMLRIYVGTSRDGIHYDHSWIYATMPIVGPGPEGSWDGGCMHPATNFVTAQGLHWLYYDGCPGSHESGGSFKKSGCNIGLAQYRQDGLVYLTTAHDDQWGTIKTRQFTLRGPSIEVNVEVGLHGRVVANVRSHTGKLVASSAPLQTSGLHESFKWTNHTDLGPFIGSLVSMEVELLNASIYAFQVLPQ